VNKILGLRSIRTSEYECVSCSKLFSVPRLLQIKLRSVFFCLGGAGACGVSSEGGKNRLLFFLAEASIVFRRRRVGTRRDFIGRSREGVIGFPHQPRARPAGCSFSPFGYMHKYRA
jgi:hypothetical protein